MHGHRSAGRSTQLHKLLVELDSGVLLYPREGCGTLAWGSEVRSSVGFQMNISRLVWQCGAISQCDSTF